MCVITTNTSPMVSYADLYNLQALFYTTLCPGFIIMQSLLSELPLQPVSCPYVHMLSNMFCSLFIWLDSAAPLREGTIWLLSLWLYVTSHKHHSGCVPSLSRQLDSSPPLYRPIKQLTGHTNCLQITTLMSVLGYYCICLKITPSNSNESQTSVSYLFRSHLRKRLYKVQSSQEKTF